jgi:hypothetical protein
MGKTQKSWGVNQIPPTKILVHGVCSMFPKSLSKNGFTSPACDGLPPNKLATAEKRLAASSAFGVQFTTQTLSEVDGGWFLAGVEKPPHFFLH